ncbi:amino acid ABC transporter substrate-binding protein [Verminephrobacter aporrectodeae subsp. tuberculatae]|nr:amino acid ABC transporter substrate-binding protein [Verminephrobacter aporrectodeae subsp. tuberculatae]
MESLVKLKTLALVAMSALGLCATAALHAADKLDAIIESGKLRCAVVLDFPPMGSRDASNNPVGFDVDYCNDLAKVLGVRAQIVETPFADRIPALTSNRVDVIVGSTSDTLERAKTVGMTIPYFAFQMVVLTRENTNIKSYEDLKGRAVGNTSSSFEALALEKAVKAWNAPKGSFRAYQTQADTLLAVSQGQIDATVVTSTVAAASIKSGKYKGLKIAGIAPYTIDYVSLAAKRSEYGLIHYLNLFVHQQVRTGRYAELYQKWVGGRPIDLTVPGVYY